MHLLDSDGVPTNHSLFSLEQAEFEVLNPEIAHASNQFVVTQAAKLSFKSFDQSQVGEFTLTVQVSNYDDHSLQVA